ncbi:MAG: transporter substrate-binding domain-containing protein [Gammaproteobacteria bacterium SHHR-1]
MHLNLKSLPFLPLCILNPGRALLLLGLLLLGGPLWALEQVSLRLQWKHQFEFAGFYAAIEQGFYREAGLEVSLHEYDNQTQPIKEVVEGSMSFGLWNDEVLRAYMQGQPVVLLANYFKESPRIIITRPEIQTPADLRGKRLMSSDKAMNSPGFQKMLERFDIKPGEIERVAPSFDIEDFIQGRVDAYQGFATNEPFQLRKRGLAFNVINPGAYSTQEYDLNLFTSRALAESRPELVQAFVAASNRGWRYALAHPQEIIELILRRYNSQNKEADALWFEYETIKQVMQPDLHPPGSTDLNHIRLLGDILVQQGLAQRPASYDAFLLGSLLWDSGLKLTAQERAFLSKHRVIRAHNELDWAPINFRRNGEPQGYFIELLQLLADKLKLRLEFVSGPSWEEFLQMLEDKQIDLMGNIVDTPSRRRFAHFTQPMASTAYSIASRQDAPFFGLSELNGKRVSVVRGFWQMELLQAQFPGIELLPVADTAAALKAVAYGQADATLGAAAVLEYHIGELMLANLRVSGEVELKDRERLKWHVAVRDDWPELASALDKAYAHLDYQELQELRNRWLLGDGSQAKQFSLSDEQRRYLDAKRSIRMCVDPDWLPFERIHQGEHQGMVADILQLAQERSGIALSLVPTRSWTQSIEFAKARKCDIFSLAMETPERRQYMDFTRPYLDFPFVIATHTTEFYIEDLESVIDRPLAMVSGYAFTELLRVRYPGIQIIEADSVLEGLQLVQQGRAYGFIGALPSVAYTLQSEGIVDLRINGKFDERWRLSIATRNDEPMLRPLMQKMLDSVSEKEKRDLYNSWYKVNYVQDIDYGLLARLAALALLLIGIMLYWNRRLATERSRAEQALQELGKAQQELQQKNRQLQILAATDPLTQLANRLRLDAVLAEEYARRQRYPGTFSLIMLDIDHFKQVNDEHGHQLGDQVLIGVAALLREHSRSTDTAGRWGGEEFLIICPATPLEGAAQLAEHLRQQIAEQEFPQVGRCTASFGVSEYRQEDSLDRLLQRADQALYQAKAEGRNRVSCTEDRGQGAEG